MSRHKVAIYACLSILGMAHSVLSQELRERFCVEVLRTSGTNLVIVRLDTVMGTCCLAVQDKWVAMPKPSNLPEGNYACSLAPVGKESWVLTLWDRDTGRTFIYASSTRKWRIITEDQ